MNLPIPRYSDALILAKFQKLGNELAKNQWQVTAHGEHWQLFAITVLEDKKDPWAENRLATEMAKGSGVATRSLTLAIDGSNIATIERQDGQPQDRITTNQSAFANDDDGRVRYLRASEAMATEFAITRTANAPFVSTTGELAQFVEARDQGLARLEELYVRLTQGMVEDRERGEKQVQAGKQ